MSLFCCGRGALAMSVALHQAGVDAQLVLPPGSAEEAALVPGMAVQVKVEGVDAPITGQLARIAPAAEAGTRSIGVTVALANSDERLRAGQYAIGQVQLPDERQRLLLPLAAVGSTSGQSHVWVIEQGKLARRAITLGRRDDAGGRIEVIDGLAADAQVLAARFDNLREGARALVVAGKVPAVASAGASRDGAAAIR